jgi:hypothetical protein
MYCTIPAFTRETYEELEWGYPIYVLVYEAAMLATGPLPYVICLKEWPVWLLGLWTPAAVSAHNREVTKQVQRVWSASSVRQEELALRSTKHKAQADSGAAVRSLIKEPSRQLNVLQLSSLPSLSSLRLGGLFKVSPSCLAAVIISGLYFRFSVQREVSGQYRQHVATRRICCMFSVLVSDFVSLSFYKLQM